MNKIELKEGKEVQMLENSIVFLCRKYFGDSRIGIKSSLKKQIKNYRENLDYGYIRDVYDFMLFIED